VIDETKSWFDKFGEYGLKEGIQGPDGSSKLNISLKLSIEKIGGYRFGGNSYEIFENFFASQNPLSDKLEDDGRD
jgi:hypothetical protein